ncbi:hypothetical protein ACET3Z_007217 [Daucus carota]
MLRCYSVSDYPDQALVLFNYMRAVGVLLDEFSLVSVVKSCARLFDVKNGCAVHSVAVKTGNVVFGNVRNTVLQLYCVCRRIEDARVLFDEFSVGRDLVSWNVLMGGYVYVSRPDVVWGLFERMLFEGVRIGGSTMLSVLSAVGEIGDGWGGECVHGYCIKRGFCFDCNVVTALVACRVYGNVDLGKSVKKALEDNYGEHPADSIVLSSTYAVAGRTPCLQTMQTIRGKMVDNHEYQSRGVKEAGCSSIELGDDDE